MNRMYGWEPEPYYNITEVRQLPKMPVWLKDNIGTPFWKSIPLISFFFQKRTFLFHRKNVGQKLQGQGARGGGEVPQPQDGLGVVRGRHLGGHGEHGVHQVHAEAGLPGILLPLPEPAELPQVAFGFRWLYCTWLLPLCNRC